MKRLLLALSIPLMGMSVHAQDEFKLTEQKTFPNTGSSSLIASPDGSFLASGMGSSVQLWNRTASGYELGELITGFSENENAVSHIAISNDGVLLAASTLDSKIHIFKRSGNTMKKVQVLTGFNYLPGYLSFSADGNFFAASNADNKCVIWKTNGGAFVKVNAPADARDFCFSPADAGIAYAGGRMYKFSGGTVSAPKKLMNQEEAFIPDAFSFSPDGNYFACLYYTESDNLAIWKKQANGSFEQSGLLEGKKWSSNFVSFSSDSRYLTVFNRKTPMGQQKFVVFDVSSGALNFNNEFGQYSETMDRMDYISDGHFAVASSKANTFLFEVKGCYANKSFKGKPILVTNTVVETPTDEPDTTSGTVLVNNVPVNTNPVVVNNITNIFWISPNPDVMNDKPVVAEKSTIEIRIKVLSGKKVGSEDIKIIINGKEQGKNKFNEVSLKESKQDELFEYTYSNSVPLEETADHLNLIEVMVNGKKTSKPIKVLYSAQKPNLHILAIGTSLDLQFPKKDAQDFADLFAGQGGSGADKLFGSVEVRTLIGKDATTNAIKESIERYRYDFKTGAIGPRDVMLVFISSHGFIYQDEFRIQGDDFKDIYKETYSVAFNEITSRLKEVNCKKLIFLDACFSGGAKASVADINNAIRDLNNQSQGVTTFSSSSNDEYSYEDVKWQNGAFTYSIKEGLAQGKADKDGNGIITVSELYEFVAAKVPAIVTEVKGKSQHPTMPVNDLLKNTPVFVVGK